MTVTANPLLLSVLNWHSGDGIGIATLFDREPTEIDNVEWLRVRFDGSTRINSFTVSNLFPDEGFLRPSDEIGYYSIDGGDWVAFSADSEDGLRDHQPRRRSRYSPSTSSRRLPACEIDFSVQPVDAVPEPTSLILVGAGLIAGAARLRRRK